MVWEIAAGAKGGADHNLSGLADGAGHVFLVPEKHFRARQRETNGLNTRSRILRDAGISKKLAGAGLVVTANPPEELAKTIQNGLDVRGKLIKAAGIQPE